MACAPGAPAGGVGSDVVEHLRESSLSEHFEPLITSATAPYIATSAHTKTRTHTCAVAIGFPSFRTLYPASSSGALEHHHHR